MLLHGQQPDFRAAAAKAAAGQEARTHAATAVPRANAAAGTFTTFDAPGAGTGFFQGTFPTGINPAGAITGYSFDANFVAHGFLRLSNGIVTTFDVPGAGNVTFPDSINPAGAIAGTYSDANFVVHGFLRASNGTFTTFDVPGAAFPFSISTAGAITGKSCDAIKCHGFLRASNGTITTFDAPGAGTGTGFFEGTNPLGITPGGGRSRASIMT